MESLVFKIGSHCLLCLQHVGCNRGLIQAYIAWICILFLLFRNQCSQIQGACESIFFLLCILRLYCNTVKEDSFFSFYQKFTTQTVRVLLTYFECSVGAHKVNKIFLAKDVHWFQWKYCFKNYRTACIVISHDCYPALHAFVQDWILNLYQMVRKGKAQLREEWGMFFTRWQHRNLKHMRGEESQFNGHFPLC